MNHHTRLIILWALLIIGMILHFNYHVSEIFYGIDVVRPCANGKMPISTLTIKTIYYHLPILYILALLYFHGKLFKGVAFGVGLIYTVAHGMHLFKEIMRPHLETPEITQINLLVIVLFISLLMNLESWKWFKSEN